MAGIRVTATDLENGDTPEAELKPGEYSLICVQPLYLDGIVRHSNGTVQLTLKRRAES